MLFSNEKVADYINKNFEPAWQSVRDVPMVTIDFGNGHVLIHAHLAKQGLVTPEAVTKWLYREVLHADLDDPYLGLGKILFPGGVPK